MEEALVVDDETESLGVVEGSHIWVFDRGGKRMMERFYNVMIESFGTGERRKPLGSANPFESYLDCDYSTGFAPRTHITGKLACLSSD